MSKFISTFFDPIGIGYGEAITGKKSGIINVSDAWKSDKGDAGAQGPGTPSFGAEGVISDAEAQSIAKKKLFRSGTISNSPLGEDVTANQLSATQLV